MRLKVITIFIAVSLTAIILMSSCIKSEAKNSEADIITCTLEGDIIKTLPTIENKTVMILIMKGIADKTALAPIFTLTPGARIEPVSGTVRDFTVPQKYTVHSEDGNWNKDYEVSIIDAEIPTEFDFENWYGTGKYENPVELVSDDDGNIGRMQIWSSGNAGYAIVKGKEPKDFPTCKNDDRKSGELSAKLETKTTGFPSLPLAAGNLFLGSFDAASAMKEPLKATRFGVPFGKKPKTFSGWYKYKAGPIYKKLENGKQVEVPGRIDSCNLYAVYYYKNKPGGDDSGNLLHGGNVMTNDRVIAFARINKPAQVDEYTRFEVDFDYNYQTAFDATLMGQYEYYLGVVFAASKDGAEFSGAAGSLLFVDEIKITCFN